jgi:hypothetical protein
MNHEWTKHSYGTHIYYCKKCGINGVLRITVQEIIDQQFMNKEIYPAWKDCEKFTCEEVQVMQVMRL